MPFPFHQHPSNQLTIVPSFLFASNWWIFVFCNRLLFSFSLPLFFYLASSPKLTNYFEQEFENLGEIGRGDFGQVFRVKSKIDGLHYAVKKARRQFRSLRDRFVPLLFVVVFACTSVLSPLFVGSLFL
jgi:hypothetical protein